MDPNRFDSVTQFLIRTPSRRAALWSGLGAAGLTAGWLRAAPESHAKPKKKKRKKSCPACVCPAPPAAPYCAGKNWCVHGGGSCTQDENPGCLCWIRADTGAPICGAVQTVPVTNCTSCAAGLVCVVLGGNCADDFTCVSPCVERH